jgi:zinc-ribbon domain
VSRTAGLRRRFFPFQRPSCGRPLAGCRFDILTLLPMRTFACQQFGHRVAFEADRCMDCATALGFLPEDRVVAVVHPAEGALMAARAEPEGGRCWRCLNAAWGCN